MSDQDVFNYEIMFVFPQAQTSDIAAAMAHIEEILRRNDAELLAMSKWGERNLATPIQKNKRGLFILTYFKAHTSKLAGIERDSNLSELIMRFLLTRADHLTLEEMGNSDARDAMITESRLRNEGQDQNEHEPVGAAVGDENGGDDTGGDASDDDDLG